MQKKKVDVQQGYWNKFTIFHTIGNNIIAEIICYNTLRRLESGKEIPYTLCRLSRSAFPLQYDDDAWIFTWGLNLKWPIWLKKEYNG